MYILNNDEAKRLDKIAFEQYALPGIILMEHAALGLFKSLITFWPSLKEPSKSIAILNGPGQNGGDGWALARILHNYGHKVDCYYYSLPKNDGKINYEIASKLNINFIKLEPPFEFEQKHYDLYIDALFGTGLNRNIDGHYQSILLNFKKIADKKPILAVDIPSGICGNTGKVLGPVCNASLTVCLGNYKQGLFLGDGPKFSNNTLCVDIGYSPEMYSSLQCKDCLLDADLCSKWLPKRPKFAHKNKFGHVIIMGGAKGCTGALAMAVEGALKSGAGLVTAAHPESFSYIYALKFTEAMTLGLPEDEKGCFGADSSEILLQYLAKLQENSSSKKVLAIGPGLGLGEDTRKALYNIIESSSCPMVLDADALTIIGSDLKILAKQRRSLVLTPHPGEAARLLNCSIDDIEADRLGSAFEISKQSGGVTLLKGHNTIICDARRYMINSGGGAYMAVGGSGDILTGLIAGFLAQGVGALKAAGLGAFYHTKGAEAAAKIKGDRGLSPLDFVQHLFLN